MVIWLWWGRKPCNSQPPIVKHDTIYIHKTDSLKNDVCYNCGDETEGQTFTHFLNVVKNYREQIWDSINAMPRFNVPTVGKNYNQLTNIYGSTDARAIWFPLDTIKKFICTIEKYNKKLKTPSGQLGVRLYYAVYEKDYPIVEKRGHHTLFMVPTYANGSGPQEDFDPRETYNNEKNSRGKPVETMSFVMINNMIPAPLLASKKFLILGGNDYEYRPSAATFSSTSAALQQNTGELCPYNCPNNNTLRLVDN